MCKNGMMREICELEGLDIYKGDVREVVGNRQIDFWF